MAGPFYVKMLGPQAVRWLNNLWDRVTEQISGTSASDLTIGNGTQNLTTQASKQFAVGMPVRITRTSDVTQWMDGQVSAYDAETGDMSVLVAATSGAGTFSNWTISLSGQSGPAGAAGDKGWSPVIAVIVDGARRVMRVIDWAGGQGAKPSSGAYVGAAGLVADIAQAVDIRGPQGDVTAALEALRDQVVLDAQAAADAALAAGQSAQLAGQRAQAADEAAGAAAASASSAGDKADEAAASAETAAARRDEAVQAATDAGQARADADTARDQAVAAKGDAVAAKGQAEAARDAAQNYAAALAGSSVTPLVPGAGPAVFATQAGKAWTLGQRLRAASDDGSVFVEGPVSAYAGTSLTLAVEYFVGAVEHADWNIALVGGRGAQGVPGLVSRGPWAAAAAYAVGDLATDDGATWERIVAGTTPTNPAADPVNWRVFARRGIDGSGSVVSVQGIAPDGGGDVTLPEATAAAAGLMPAADKGKLDGVAAGATANAADSHLLDRANHTGEEPISAVSGLQAALDAKIPLAEKGAVGGVATLDGGGKVPAAQLPSFVDDVLEYASQAAFPAVGESGRIYVALDTNKTYRWSGSTYVEISASPGSTDAVPEGAMNQYFTAARVRAAVLTGLSTAVNAAIAATDTMLAALGKLQRQITDNAAAAANASNLTSGSLDDARLPPVMTGKQLTSMSETSTSPAISGGTLVLDCSAGNQFTVSLNANITTLTIANPPAAGKSYAMDLEFVADGTARTIAWPGTVKWPGGTSPSLTAANGKADVFVLRTRDGGATWRAFKAGQNS